MQPGRARTSGLGVPLLPLARWVCWVAPVRPTHGVLVLSCPSAALRVCSVLGRLAPVHRCARAVCCVASAVSWATWLLFTGVCLSGVLCCVCGVLGRLAPVHRCARWVCFVVCAVSRATWPLFTGAPARCVALRVRCPGPLGSCSPVCPLGALCCVCGVLGHLAPVHRCARSVRCVACAMSWAPWLLFNGALARCVALRARCPGPLGCCSPVCQAVVSRPFVALGARACVVACVFAFCSPRGLFLCFSLAPLFLLACFALFFFLWGVAGVRRFSCCALVWVCAGAGAGVGVAVVGDGGRVPVALCVPCVCAGPQASGFQGAGPGGADGGWLAAVVAWRLRGWSRPLGSAWVAWPGAGARVGVFMAWADGVVGSVGMAGLCGCRVCVRRRRGGLGWGTVGDATGGGRAGNTKPGTAAHLEKGHQNMQTHTTKKKKEPAAQPKKKGMRGQGPQGQGQGHPATDTTKRKRKKKRKKHTPTTQPRRAGHRRDPSPARTPTPHSGTGSGGGQAERARNHTRPISRPKPKPHHERHKQPAKEEQHHKPCPNTPGQDPSQDWRG